MQPAVISWPTGCILEELTHAIVALDWMHRSGAIRNQFQVDMAAIDHLLASVGEVHRDAVSDAGLHLTRSPVRRARMAHDHSWFKYLIHVAAPVAAQQG